MAKARIDWYDKVQNSGNVGTFLIEPQVSLYGTGFPSSPYVQVGVQTEVNLTDDEPTINTKIRAQIKSVALSTWGVTLTDADISGAPYIQTSQNSLTLTFNMPTRTLNSGFQISTNQNALVSYCVDIACTLSLTTGQSGTVFLEYADDSGFTTNLVSFAPSTNANTGTLAIGLNLTQTYTATVSGVIPIGKWVRLRTANNTGTPTFTFKAAQEVLI